jgi:hypothetical protein
MFRTSGFTYQIQNTFHERAKPKNYDTIKSTTILTPNTKTDIYQISGLSK